MEKTFLDLENLEIECPNCKSKFLFVSAISEHLKNQLYQSISLNISKEVEQRKNLEISKIQRELEAQFEQRLLEREKFQQSKEFEYRRAQQELELKLQQMINEKELEKQRILAENMNTIELLKKQYEETRKELEEAKRVEMELRRREDLLLEKEKNLELEIQRKLDEEKARIHNQVMEQIESKYQLKFKEKDQVIESLQKQIEQLNYKLQIGSQQLQGESQELVLEEKLKQKFPLDNIKPVPKGIRGADIIQEVYDNFGNQCGTILWESKRTKDWSNDWIPKLKEDQRELGAEVAIIVSQALPKEISSVGLLDGVWVSNFQSFIGLAMALREGLVQIKYIKNALVGKETKMEQLYNYISSQQFVMKITAILEAFKNMKSDLEQEKRAMEKIWARRETEIEKIIKNTARIYGELQALVGREQLGDPPHLELPINSDNKLM